MTTCTEPEIDVTGVAFAAAVASVREHAAGLVTQIGLLPPAAARAVLGSLTALREDIARVEVAVVAHFVKLGAPKHDGARSTEAWLEQHAQKSAWTAKQVTNAIAASASPLVRDALERAELGVEHAAAIAPLVARVLEGRCEAAELSDLVASASRQTVWHTRQSVAKLLTRLDEAEGEPASSHRSMTGSATDHGTKVWRLELEPDAHATVDNAVMKLVDEAWRAGHPDDSRPPTQELARLRADATVEMCRRILRGTSAPSGTVVRSGGLPEVIVIVDHDTLVGRIEGAARLADGTIVPGETARRIACDAGILPVVMNGRSEVLDLGRAKRLASIPQRRALLALWCTCGFPGCTVPVPWTKAHHLDPWKPGGTTDLGLLVPLCERHHHFVHEGGWRIRKEAEGFVFVRPDGAVHDVRVPNGGGP